MGAYLVGYLDLSARPPVVRVIDIFSANAGSLTTMASTYAFDIVKVEGYGYDSYHKCKMDLIEWMATEQFRQAYFWVYPLLTDEIKESLKKEIQKLNMDEALK